MIQFKDKTKVLDVGTGGGFPGIPLAILFPQVQFVLVDSIGKKIKVVKEVVDRLGLENVKAYHKRAEEVNEQFDFVVTRAVARIKKFIPWVKGRLHPESFNDLKNGVLFLKGGDLSEEEEAIGSGCCVNRFKAFIRWDFTIDQPNSCRTTVFSTRKKYHLANGTTIPL